VGFENARGDALSYMNSLEGTQWIVLPLVASNGRGWTCKDSTLKGGQKFLLRLALVTLSRVILTLA
jgi:hypothetical protein